MSSTLMPCRRCGTGFRKGIIPTVLRQTGIALSSRYKLSYRDVAELFLLRGFTFTHETVRDSEERFGPIFADELRAKRKGKIGKTWHVDETYLLELTKG